MMNDPIDVRQTKHYVALDGMRGLAALIVVIFHIKLYFFPQINLFPFVTLYDHAYLMVDCFLVISGFVIAHAFDRRMSAGLSVPRFMILRAARLYPMVVVGVALGAVTLLAWRHVTPQVPLMPVLSAIASALVLLPTTALAAYKGFSFPVNSPHWSLSMEMVLYVVYATTLCRLKGPLLCAALGVSACALLMTAYAAEGLDIGYFVGDYVRAFGRVAYPFLAGIAIRRCGLFKPSTQRYGYLALPLLALLAVNPVPAGWIYDAVAGLVLLPMLVWLVASARPVASLDAGSSHLGDLSYPIYAIHFPVVVALANIAKARQFGLVQTGLLAALCLVVVVTSASVIHRYYDRPLRRALLSRIKQRDPASRTSIPSRPDRAWDGGAADPPAQGAARDGLGPAGNADRHQDLEMEPT